MLTYFLKRDFSRFVSRATSPTLNLRVIKTQAQVTVVNKERVHTIKYLLDLQCCLGCYGEFTGSFLSQGCMTESTKLQSVVVRIINTFTDKNAIVFTTIMQ